MNRNVGEERNPADKSDRQTKPTPDDQDIRLPVKPHGKPEEGVAKGATQNGSNEGSDSIGQNLDERHMDPVVHFAEKFHWRLTIELSGLPGWDGRAWLHHIRGGQARPAATAGRSNELLGDGPR